MSNGDTESLIGSDSDYQSGVRIAQTILKKYKGRSHAQRIGRASRKSPSLNFSSYRIEDENSSSEDGNSSPRKEEKSKRKYDRFSRTNHYMQDEENDHDCFDSKYPIAHHDLYCQKSSSSSSSSREDNSSNYIGGAMYPATVEGDLSRYMPSSTTGSFGVPLGLSFRAPICRPKFWKFLLLIVVLLMMAQFSLNILFYRNYDSLFYVNVTSGESLATFESRVRWVSSKLPWVHSTTVNPITVVPLHNPAYISSAPLMIGEKIAKLTPDGKKEKTVLQYKVEALDREKAEQLKNVFVPADKIPDEGGGNASSNISLYPHPSNAAVASAVISHKSNIKFPKPAHAVKPTENITSRSVPSKVVENSSIKARASVVSQIGSSLESVNTSNINNGFRESKRTLLSKEKPLCPPVPPNLVGQVKIYRTVPSLEEQERSRPELEPGGRFRPSECRARHRVAIIVPYRDRIKHLAMFIFHVHPILQRQQIDYAIYVVEQAGSGKFNRAMLLNVGALEALKQYKYDCFVFHDVDLLPEDDRNLYTCPEQPRHMSIAIDSMSYKLPYNDIFGGVSAMTVEQFRIVNGFSNKFWGWGGEDDDMSNRIKFHGFFISRYPANIGRYSMLSHRKDEPNPRRYQYLYDGKKRFKSDGLNSAKYRALDVQLRRLYTWVYVDLYPS